MRYKVENARLMFTNFSGAETQYNAAGKRNFCVEITNPDMIDSLKKEGVNIKTRQVSEYDPPIFYVKVNVNFNSAYPPEVNMYTRRKVNRLDEMTVGMLDNADIIDSEVEFTTYTYDPRSGGSSCYLRRLEVAIAESNFAKRYLDDEGPEEIPFS